MSRPIVKVKYNNKILTAILDTGAKNSYIRKDIAKDAIKVTTMPFEARLGGKKIKIKEGRLIEGFVFDSKNRKYKIGVILYPVDELGEEEGKRIDILFGALLLEDWETIIDESTTPPSVDFKRLREGILTEL